MTESTARTNVKKVVIAGGSGFLGISLAHYLAERDIEVIILSRNAPAAKGPWQHRSWDGRSLGDWAEVLDGADALVNLAGRTVDCIKTPENRDAILRSRVETTRVLGAALKTVAQPPPVWVQMSTAHIYGDPATAVCTEDSPFGVGLAPHVGQAWEQAFAVSRLPEQRGVVLRTSFVVGRERGAGQGALGTLAPLARWGLGGRVGSGRQGMSWIHEEDMNRIIWRAITDEQMQGAYIASAPSPLPQVDFMRELRRAVRMPIGLPAFGWMVRLGAPLVLRTDPELALYGRFVQPARLVAEGFDFKYPDLGSALAEIFG